MAAVVVVAVGMDSWLVVAKSVVVSDSRSVVVTDPVAVEASALVLSMDKVVAGAVDVMSLVTVVAITLLGSEEEGRHGPALTIAKAANRIARELGKIMITNDDGECPE
jgi:hypothetical protein